MISLFAGCKEQQMINNINFNPDNFTANNINANRIDTKELYSINITSVRINETNITSVNTNTTNLYSNFANITNIYSNYTRSNNLSVNFVNFDQLPTVDCANATQGMLFFSAHDKALSYKVNGICLQIGEEEYVTVVNKLSTQIDNCKVVYINGAQGNRPTVNYSNDIFEKNSYLLGLATQDIAVNTEGKITVHGLVHDCDTSAWPEGTILYLSQISGNLTSVKDPAPFHSNMVGFVISQHAVQGTILVAPTLGFELDELHDVKIVNASKGDLLTYNGSLWLNSKNLSGNMTIDGILTTQGVYGEMYKTSSRYLANSTYVGTGTLAAGNVNNLTLIDNSFTIVNEVVGAPGFQQYYNFSNGASQPGAFAWVGYYFPCLAAHNVKVYAYNGTAYEALTTASTDIACGTSASDVKYLFQFPTNSSRFNINGNISVLISHDSAGSATHRLGTDFVALFPKDFIFVNPGQYYNITGYNAGLNQYVTLNTTAGTMKIQVPGVYKLCYDSSYRGTPLATIHADVFVNNVEFDKIAYTRRLNSNGDVDVISMCGLLNLTTNDVINIQAKADESNDYINYASNNLNIERIN